MAKKPISDTRAEYKHQWDLLSDRIARAEKAGFIFDRSKLPTFLESPRKASIEKLKALRTDTLRSKAKYLDKSTGEIVSGKKGVKLQRKEASEKAYRTRIEREVEKQKPAENQVIDYEPRKPAITIEDIKAIEDPSERNQMWEEWWQETHEAKSREEQEEEMEEVEERTRQYAEERIFGKKEDVLTNEEYEARKKEQEDQLKKVRQKELEEYYGHDQTIVNTLMYNLESIQQTALSKATPEDEIRVDGYTYIMRQINKAINDRTIGLHKVAQAIEEMMDEQAIEMTAIAYDVSVAVSFFNDLMGRINGASYNPIEASDIYEAEENGWDEIG